MLPNDELMKGYDSLGNGKAFCISNSIANRLQREGIACSPIEVKGGLQESIIRYAEVKIAYDRIGSRITLSDLTDEWFNNFCSKDMRTLIVWSGLFAVNYFSYGGKIYRDYGYDNSYGIECPVDAVKRNVLDVDEYIRHILENDQLPQYNSKMANTVVDVVSKRHRDIEVGEIRKILFSSYLLEPGLKMLDSEKYFLN